MEMLMAATRPSQTPLKRALLIDATATGMMGLLLTIGAAPLESLLGLPAALLRWAGAALIPFAALLAYLALKPNVRRGVVWTLVGVNVLWAIDSFLLLASGWVDPTTLGTTFVIVQAVAVMAFAYMEYDGVRTAS
jgi:hypothetical protein